MKAEQLSGSDLGRRVQFLRELSPTGRDMLTGVLRSVKATTAEDGSRCIRVVLDAFGGTVRADLRGDVDCWHQE